MKVHIAQINPTIGDIAHNAQKVIEHLSHVGDGEILLCPELTLPGYPPEDLVYLRAFIEEQERALETIVSHAAHCMAVVGLVRFNASPGEKHLVNSVAIIQDGVVCGYYDKMLLPTYDVFDERRYFASGKTIGHTTYRGSSIGIVICEDMWQHAGYVQETHYTKDPIELLSEKHIDVLLNASASPFQMAKSNVRKEVCSQAAKTLGCPVVYCNQVGANGQILFDGGSIAVLPNGSVFGQAAYFTEDHVVFDLEHGPTEVYPEESPIEHVYHALVLGVKDYFAKNNRLSACIAVSGGIDSALVAAIACDALGPERVLGISMPSKYTSEQSKIDAKHLADRLGFAFVEHSITESFEQIMGVLNVEGGVTEENVQARLRGTILMGYANEYGHLALATGNKSELAVGYSTLYGDMCGALEVLGDVKKTFVYKLAAFCNKEKERIPKSILTKEPSAELRHNQKDSDTLPPYEVIDAVIEGYVEEHLQEDEIADRYGIEKDTVQTLVKMIHASEYKRRQSPPIIRVTKKAFGVGRRFPLVQNWR